ncbi:MAG: toll/interleukin-1 receptor domain-containing protein, partial [Treponema sp.]|nr:toll/interleukin-1 receptor domain-containing protein [Treponema sp.]
MINAFLSHSSQQKGYVEMVAKKLGKFSVIYDAWTFEIGNKTIDEIFSGIDASGIFVYFISNEAMESPWVEKEINKAEEYLKNGKLKRFLPLLIDNTVKHTDSRIPYWIKEEYN